MQFAVFFKDCFRPGQRAGEIDQDIALDAGLYCTDEIAKDIEDHCEFILPINKITTDSCSSHRVINKLTANLLKISLQKNMFLSNRSFLLSAKTMREKIFGYLDNISLQNHSNEFDIPFDRQQLADFLKIDRTSLSKELSKMQSEGLITYKKNHFIIDKDQRTKSQWNKSNGCVISC